MQMYLCVCFCLCMCLCKGYTKLFIRQLLPLLVVVCVPWVLNCEEVHYHRLLKTELILMY